MRQVVTALVKHPATDQDHLVAWISPKDVEPKGLLQQLQGSLPEYMIPTVMVRLDHLPLLVSEKIDRKALPAPDFASDAVSIAPAAPAQPVVPASTNSTGSSEDAGPLTQFVSAVWREVLGLQTPVTAIGTADDFFALGGNSLLAGKMNSTLRAGLSLPDMSGMLIYQHPTLPAFVAALAEQDPLVPELPGMEDGSADGSSTYCNFFASLRKTSFSTAGGSSFTAGHAASSTHSFTTTNSSRPSSFSIPNNGSPASRSCRPVAGASAFASPGLTTVFSGTEADSSPPRGLLKQLSRSLTNTTASKDQQLDSDNAALPVAMVPTAHAPTDSLTTKLSKALSLTESLSFRNAFNTPGTDAADRLPVSSAVDGNAKPKDLAQGKADQDRPISRANSTTKLATNSGTGKEDDSAGTLQPPTQVKPSLVLATLLQLLCMSVVSGVYAVLTLAPSLISMYILLESGWRALVLLPVFELGAWLLLAMWSVCGKWLVIGRYKECEVPLWGQYYLRHWVAHLFVLVSVWCSTAVCLQT